ncbi:MAG: sulfotransferase domain-containing protein [Myxococcota bacterium]
MLKVVKKRVSRFVARKSRFFQSVDKRNAAEMQLRGRTEKDRLDQTDTVVISCGKSGRTWVRVMLSAFYQIRQGESPEGLADFAELHADDDAVPNLLFTHDTYLRHFTEVGDSKADYFGHNVVLLVRHPADVAVSRFFQWKHRMKPRKIKLRGLPDRSEDLSIFDFVMDGRAGLPQICHFMTCWADAMPEIKHSTIVRYEDLREDPQAELAKLTEFFGTPGKPEEIEAAVDFGAFDNMKKREAKAAETAGSGMRLRPGDAANQDSYKVRRGKVGGYRDYFEDDEIKQIDEIVARQLPALYGY